MVGMYSNLALGAETVESTLRPSVAEFLNAEIVLRTVTDVSRAVEVRSHALYTTPVSWGLPCPKGQLIMDSLMAYVHGMHVGKAANSMLTNTCGRKTSCLPNVPFS